VVAELVEATMDLTHEPPNRLSGGNQIRWTKLGLRLFCPPKAMFGRRY